MSQFSEVTNIQDELAFNATQQQLWKALSNKDLYDFEIALDMGADPLCPNDQHNCVYELALSTYGCGEFVKRCLKSGCSPHYVNQHLIKAAINYAADSIDPQIVKILLGYRNVKVNHTASNQMTPLNNLAVNVTNENIDDVIECLASLLQYGASAFIGDSMQITPKQHIMANQHLKEANKKKILYCIESLRDIDCSSENLGMTEELKILRQFLISIKHSDNVTFDLLMAPEGHVNYNGTLDNISPYEQALTSGNSYALKRLLMQPDLNMKAVKCPLILVISSMMEESGDHRQCFYMLLKSKRVDINECNSYGSTALHTAILQRNNEAVRELLKRGARLGVKNHAEILALEGVDPELLLECFDNCVTSNGYNMGDSKFEICMNYENLMAPPKPPKANYEEMTVISFILKSKAYRHLIYHPLIISFLFLKWRQLCNLFYTNFLLYVFFAFSLITHTVLKFSGSDIEHDNMSNSTIAVFWIMSWFSILYMIIRECLQMILVPRKYFYSKVNYMELLMIALAIMTCVETKFDPHTQRIIAVCLLLLIALELFLLLGSLPAHSISTHMIMFEVVCKSFLRSFLLYSIFVVTFGLCFYILFGGEESDGDLKDNTKINRFANPLVSIVHTIVMLTGELNAGDMELNTLYTYLLFLLFVFLMTMVLYNLLNGLAVSDIQAIQGQAKQSGAMCNINYLTRYEGILSRHSEQLTFQVNLNRFQPLCRGLMHLYPKHKNDFGMEMEDSKRKSMHSIDDRRIVKMAMKVLERKLKKSKQQQRRRNHENRFNSIDRRLEEIYEMLESKRRDEIQTPN